MTSTRPHRRYDPLRAAWVLVSAGRDARPWRGQLDPAPAVVRAAYDPACELCPGNVRAGGTRNPDYRGTFVFDNDFPPLQEAGSTGDRDPAPSVEPGAADPLFRAEDVAGVARVLCFSPRHHGSLGALPAEDRRTVIDTWAEQTRELGKSYRWVQAFENRGSEMGASNPHPHGQIWASSSLPDLPAREDEAQRAHHEATGHALLDDVREREAGGERVVALANSWLAVVPFWATWPFETLLLGPAGAARLDDLDARGRDDLAALLGRLLTGYDALFDRPFPYSMGWHQAPFGLGSTAHWRLHAHVYPPLLRADARKFMVGYELLAEPQRDLTPEDAAARLRAATPA